MDPSIRIIGNTGKEGKGENQFAQPRGICVDNATKELFIVDCNNHRIQVYHLNSLAYIRQIGKGVQGDAPGSLNYAVGVCLDENNQLFVADTNNHRVVVFNRITGGHVRTIGSQGTARGCLYSPYGVCIDMYTNVLYVADYDNHRIQAFNKDTGEFIRIIGVGFGAENGQMNQPIVVCIDYELDYLLVADYSNNRVIVFDKESGSFVRNIGTGTGLNSLSGPRGLCICKEVNLLFVADREHHRIQLYDKTTYECLRSIGDVQGINPGQFFRPMEVCVNVEEGVLIVVDGYNHRVQIMEIPELQAEKRRLKALALSKAEAELNGRTVPKPSMLSVCAQLTGQELVLVDPITKALRLRFDHLGPLYDVHVPQGDVPLLLTHLTAILSQNEYKRWSPVPEPMTNSSAQLPPPHSLADRQADMFLSILESLCPASHQQVTCASAVDGVSYMLVAPALFALHSLLDRGWRPSSICPAVIQLLAGFLANIGGGIAAEAERGKVLGAIVALLRAGIATSEEVLESVLEAVLGCMERPVRYIHCEGGAFLSASVAPHIAGPFDVDTDSSTVLLAYFDILGAIFGRVGDHPRENAARHLTPALSRSSSKVSMAVTPATAGYSTASVHERRKHSNELRKDVLDFLFGVSFISNLHDSQAARVKPLVNESTRTLTIPLPGAAPATAVTAVTTVTTPPPAVDVPVHAHPAFAMHPHIGAQIAAAAASAAENHTNSVTLRPTDPATATAALPCTVVIRKTEGIRVPIGLCPLVRAAYRVRRLRKPCQLTRLSELHDASDIQALLSTTAASSSHGAQLESLQIELFCAASQYFHNLRSSDWGIAHAGLGGVALSKRTRGGRNIWRPTEPLAPGDLVDAQDKEKCWFESIVQEIQEDGSIKVHFMGWGSKWDDVIASAELTERLAPLNMKTKNWRADLFQGGLIEIKCNDDPINQKWMWGRITALNVEEAWVEVSYLFSNEPTVVKRAWLFGETICPVGMHTKDKSKAAAALLVKPLKKVEDIIRERAEEALPGDEAMFFDKADDLDDSLSDADLPYPSAAGPSSKAACTPLTWFAQPPSVSELHSLRCGGGGDPLQVTSFVGVAILECLMSELVSVVTEMIATKELETAHMHTEDGGSVHRNVERFEVALSLIAQIAATPFRRLLVPYFTRVLIFQCGVRAKLVSGGILSSKLSTVALSGLQDLSPVVQILDRFKSIATQHNAVLESALGAALSPAALQEITNRITATVDRCGVTQVANDLIELILQQNHLRYELFARFLQADRFGERSLKLRKILSYLFKTASRKEAARFQALFEGNLMAAELQEVDFTPQLKHQRVMSADWALQLVTGVVRLFQTAQSVARLEMLNIPQCHLAAERAMKREFAALPSRSIEVFAKALAAVLDSLLDSSQLPERQPSWKQATLQSVLEVLKNVMSEEMLHFFGPAYEVLLARRLLRVNYSSLAEEKSVLDALPALPHAHKMLMDVTQTSHVAEFGKYLMNKIDSDELPYTPVLNLVLQKRQFNVHTLCQHTWHKHAYNAMYAQLTLPAPIQVIQTQFNAYYKASQDASRNNTAGKRLIWCLGSGTVTLTCHLRGGTKVDIVVNEPQAAVLFAFNKGDHSKSLSALCAATNLAMEEVRSVVASLISVTSHVPLLTVDSASRGAPSRSDDTAELTAGSRVRLSEALSQEDHCAADNYAHRSEDSQLSYATNFTSHVILGDVNAVMDWRNQQVDACIVRVLKQAARRAGFSSDKKTGCAAENTEILTSTELIEHVSAELTTRAGNTNVLLSNKIILLRADHLAALAFIDKVDLLTTQNADTGGDSVCDVAVRVGYCYLPSSVVSAPPRDELGEHELHEPVQDPVQSRAASTTTGAELYEQLLCMVVEASETRIKDSVSASDARDAGPAPQEDEGDVIQDDGEADGGSTGDCGESKNEVTAPVPVQSSTPALAPHLVYEDGIRYEDFSRGLIHMVTSFVPSVTARDSPTVVVPHWERSALASVDPIDTSARFGNPALSPLRPVSASKSMGGETKNRDSPVAPSTPPPLRWYPRTSPHAAFPTSASPPRGTPARQPPVLLGSTPTVVPSLSFPPLPSASYKGLSAVHSSHANGQLKVIHECTYASFSLLLSQVNTLLYQHSLGRILRRQTSTTAEFPPPDISAYITEVSKAFALDCPALADWSALHQALFFALPAEVITSVLAKFGAVIDSDSGEQFARLTAPSQQWSRKFTVAGQKSQHSTDDKLELGGHGEPGGAASESGHEDSKAQSAEEEGAPPTVSIADELNISDSIVQISLGEFVLSAFASTTVAVNDVPSEAGTGQFAGNAPLFQSHTNVPSLNHSYHSGELSPHTAGIVSKNDKRRSRIRSRPSTASHSRSTPPARRPSADDRSQHSADTLRPLRGDSLSARENAYSDLSASIARLREAERNLYAYDGEESREIDRAAGESASHASYMYPEAPYFGSHASSGATSRTSSRSNSHGDFAVAQLMHSIEEQLRAPVPVSQLTWSSPREESTKDSLKEGDERLAPLHQHPISAEFIFKPEQKVFMAPMTDRPSPSTAAFGTLLTSAKHSGSSLFSSTGPGKPVTALPLFTRPSGGGESLQGLIGRYYQHFLSHLTAEFLPETARTRYAGNALDPNVCMEVVRHLLQSAAQHVADLAASEGIDSPMTSVWFLSSNLGSPSDLRAPENAEKLTLDGLLRAAFSLLDVNGDGLLTPSDFPALIVTASPDGPIEKCAGALENSRCGPDATTGLLVVDIVELISLSTKLRQQDFTSFVRSARNALELPDQPVLQLLAEHRWSAEVLVDKIFTRGYHQLTQSGPRKSFLRLSDSFADIYARQIVIDRTRATDWTTQIDRGAASYETASALCEHCQRAACCDELFALRCRHYSCTSCWKECVDTAVQNQAGHVTCMLCASSKDGADSAGMQVAGLDLIAAVSCPATVQTYFSNRMRLFAEDYASANEAQASTNDKLEIITIQCAPRAHAAAGTELGIVSTAVSSPGRNTPPFASTPPPPRARPATSPRSAGTPSGPPAPPPRMATPTRPMTGTSRNPTGTFQSALMKKFFDGSGMGVDLSAWGIERAEGHISRYLLETRQYMLAQTTEMEQQLKVTQSTAKFETLTNKLSLLDQYLRAVSLIEHIEQGSNLRSRDQSNLRLHSLEEALEALRDSLIVSHIKMRSKWAIPDGLSAAVARETLSTMRLRMHQVVNVMASESIVKHVPLRTARPSASSSSPYEMECRKKYTARSLVVNSVRPGTSTSLAVAALVSQPEEPWKLFGDLSVETLTMPIPTARATEQTTAMDKFAECRKLVEKLSSHRTLNQIVLSRHLKALEALVESGYQTVLFANNICPVLISVIEHNLESFPICHLVCSVLEKLCMLNAPCAQCLIDLNVWRLLTLLFAKRRNDSEFCIAGSRLMTSMLTSSEENKKASFAAIENSSLFEILKRVLKIHQVDFHTSQPLIQAIVHSVDKSYTEESTFIRSGLCEALLACIQQFGAFPGMKMQFVVLISRLASGNKLMQETLISLRVFEPLIDVLNDYAVSDPMLIKSTCFAISALVSRHHPGQTKFATAGGCKAICRALRLSQDLHTLTYILRAVAALAQQNAYVQDFFQLESAVDVLLAKKDEVIALSERSQSFETKSKLNLLLLTCEYALDAVRSPAGRRPIHSATEEVESSGDGYSLFDTGGAGMRFLDTPGLDDGRIGFGGATVAAAEEDERGSGEQADWLV